MIFRIRKSLAPYVTAEGFRIQVRGPHVNYVYSYSVTQAKRGALRCISYQKGIIQGHSDNRCPTREALSLCFFIVFQAVLSLDVNTETVFLYDMSVQYTLRDYFWCFFVSVLCTGYWAKQTKSIQFFKTALVINIWEHRWILLLLLIDLDWFKHSHSSVSGSKCIWNRFGCIFEDHKRFSIEMFTSHNGLHNKFAPNIFHTFIGFEFRIDRVFIVPTLYSISTFLLTNCE